MAWMASKGSDASPSLAAAMTIEGASASRISSAAVLTAQTPITSTARSKPRKEVRDAIIASMLARFVTRR